MAAEARSGYHAGCHLASPRRDRSAVTAISARERQLPDVMQRQHPVCDTASGNSPPAAALRRPGTRPIGPGPTRRAASVLIRDEKAGPFAAVQTIWPDLHMKTAGGGIARGRNTIQERKWSAPHEHTELMRRCFTILPRLRGCKRRTQGTGRELSRDWAYALQVSPIVSLR